MSPTSSTSSTGPRSISPRPSSSSGSPSCCSRCCRPTAHRAALARLLRVPDTAAGVRLDRFLAEEVGSRAAAERVIAAGVLVDGEARPKSWRLQGGEELEFEPPDAPAPIEREDVPLRIAYEDDHLLVVDKPAGVVVHPAAGHASGTLVHGLVVVAGGGREERRGSVPRLHRATSRPPVVA